MSLRRLGATLVGAGLVVLVSWSGCTTDVVPLSQAQEQELYCEESLDDAGTGCQGCYWIGAPKAPCKICWVSKGKKKSDTCHGLDGGPVPELWCKEEKDNCKQCAWSDDPKAPCEKCWDGKTMVVIVDTCSR